MNTKHEEFHEPGVWSWDMERHRAWSMTTAHMATLRAQYLWLRDVAPADRWREFVRHVAETNEQPRARPSMPFTSYTPSRYFDTGKTDMRIRLEWSNAWQRLADKLRREEGYRDSPKVKRARTLATVAALRVTPEELKSAAASMRVSGGTNRVAERNRSNHARLSGARAEDGRRDHHARGRSRQARSYGRVGR